jgi:SAM-dependent methyltransferase
MRNGAPIRQDLGYVREVLRTGNARANAIADQTLQEGTRRHGHHLLKPCSPARSLVNVGSDDERDLVRRGYDALSHHYRRDDADDGQYAPWLADLHGRLPPAAAVLDLGCGCGGAGRAVPRQRWTPRHRRGHQRGADRAGATPGAHRTFLREDAIQLELPPASFDAVVCLYALIHMPLVEQPQLIHRIGTWLRPGGWLLATVGHGAWTGTEDNWLGGPAPMWWSHADAATYRAWLQQAGMTITAEDLVPERESAHTLFWAYRPQTRADPR